MNKQIYKIAGVTENDFKNWCKEFFARLADGRLVRDEKTHKLITKRRSK